MSKRKPNGDQVTVNQEEQSETPAEGSQPVAGFQDRPDDGETEELDPGVLRAQLDELKSSIEVHEEKYLRAVAEAENTRRRAENDVSNARKFAVENFAAEVLSVRDSLELASAVEVSAEDSEVVEKMKVGLELTLKQLDAVFGKFGIEVIDPAPGDKLDPDKHQAMSMQETADYAPNHIVGAIQKGYSIHDRLLRPAMVIVAKAVSKSEAQAEAENT